MHNTINKVLIYPDKMKEIFFKILDKKGIENDKAVLLAEIFTKNSLDGVYSHGVNRFKKFIEDIENNIIKGNNTPSLKNSFSGFEQWDGNMGAGPVNAFFSTERAMELASRHGIGCVTLSNTTHWMRAGYYGWQAAEKGFILIAWTNTIAIMPAWGAIDCKLGNNPLVMAAPFNKKPIVLDMAMSQFSYGLMQNYRFENKELPVNGGYDEEGILTKNPYKILKSKRPLPIGFWKGAGFAFILDILSTIMSGGQSTSDITKSGHEHGCSQVFIAIDTSHFENNHLIIPAIQKIIEDYKQSTTEGDTEITYPSERVIKSRNENLKNGIPVNQIIWNKIISMLN